MLRFVSTEHLFLAIASEDRDPAGPLLAKLGASHEAILQALTTVRGTQRVVSQNPEATYESLKKYARDLTELARRSNLDPVIGRDEEIRRVMQNTGAADEEQSSADRRTGSSQDGDCRRTGATERLRRRARRVENQAAGGAGSAALVAGAKYRGEFEVRLKVVLGTLRDFWKWSFPSTRGLEYSKIERDNVGQVVGDFA